MVLFPFGQDLLAESVYPLKAVAPHDHDSAAGEEPFQHHLFVFAFPRPPSFTTGRCSLEISRAHRSAGADKLDELIRRRSMLLDKGAVPLLPGFLFTEAGSGVGVILDRQETRLMRPGFEDLALRQELFEPDQIEIANAAVQHQIRAAVCHRDRIDLKLPHAPNRLQHRVFSLRAHQTGSIPLGSQQQCARAWQ